MQATPRQEVRELFRAAVIPVVTIEREADAVPLARALAAGGLDVVEITLRTPAALGAIRRVRAELPDVIVGAGTLLTAADVEAALAAGARFLVSPGTTAALFAAAAAAGVPYLPGVATASEAMAAAERGFAALKLFPAEAVGGVRLLQALAAPLPQLSFCPTGGIDAGNASAYLALPTVAAVGGSWVAPKAAVQAQAWPQIIALAAAAARLRPRGRGLPD